MTVQPATPWWAALSRFPAGVLATLSPCKLVRLQGFSLAGAPSRKPVLSRATVPLPCSPRIQSMVLPDRAPRMGTLRRRGRWVWPGPVTQPPAPRLPQHAGSRDGPVEDSPTWSQWQLLALRQVMTPIACHHDRNGRPAGRYTRRQARLERSPTCRPHRQEGDRRWRRVPRVRQA